MNTDIRVKISLLGSRKLNKLAKSLEIEEAHAVGLLTCLWVRTGIDNPKGDLKDWDNQDIAAAAGWTGNADDFVKALKGTGWIDWDGKKKCCKIHDWEVHQSWACHADERSEQAKKAVNSRWARSYTDSNTGSNSGSNTPFLSSPSPLPSNTSPAPILDLTVPPAKAGTIPFYEGDDITDVYWYDCKNCKNKQRIKCDGRREINLLCPVCKERTLYQKRL